MSRALLIGSVVIVVSFVSGGVATAAVADVNPGSDERTALTADAHHLKLDVPDLRIELSFRPPPPVSLTPRKAAAAMALEVHPVRIFAVTALGHVRYPWQTVGGVAFRWRRFPLIVFVGHGYTLLPTIDPANPTRSSIPDA
jgi:hypothetical protein